MTGKPGDLAESICPSADLRIYTEFLHNEHIDVDSPSNERILEVAELGVTYCIERTWSAGVADLCHICSRSASRPERSPVDDR